MVHVKNCAGCDLLINHCEVSSNFQLRLVHQPLLKEMMAKTMTQHCKTMALEFLSS